MPVCAPDFFLLSIIFFSHPTFPLEHFLPRCTHFPGLHFSPLCSVFPGVLISLHTHSIFRHSIGISINPPKKKKVQYHHNILYTCLINFCLNETWARDGSCGLGACQVFWLGCLSLVHFTLKIILYVFIISDLYTCTLSHPVTLSPWFFFVSSLALISFSPCVRLLLLARCISYSMVILLKE